MTKTTATNYSEITPLLIDLERTFLAIWSGRAVNEIRDQKRPGKGSLAFTQHTVMTPAVSGGDRPVLIELVEVPAPLWFYKPGTTRVRFTAAYRTGTRTHWRANGYFHVGVGVDADDLPPTRVQIVPEDGAKVEPPSRDAFPGNVSVPAQSAKGLRAQMAEVDRIADRGWRDLYKERNVLWGLRDVRSKADGRFADGTGVFDLDDTAQEYRRQVAEEANRYASYRRHGATWSEVVKRNCLREPYRRYNETRPEPQIINEIRHWIAALNIPLTTPAEEVRAIKARHTEMLRWRKKNRAATMADAEAAVAAHVDPKKCRWTLDQIQRAMKPPTAIASIDQPQGDGTTTLQEILPSDGGDFDQELLDTVQDLADATGLDVEEVVALAIARREFCAEEFPANLVAKAMEIRSDRARFASIADRIASPFEAEGDDAMLAAVTRGGSDGGPVVYRPTHEIASEFRTRRLF